MASDARSAATSSTSTTTSIATAGIGYHTPASVHFGTAAEIRASRDLVLASAYAAHPDRFVNGIPTPPLLPGPAWINRPKEEPAQIIR